MLRPHLIQAHDHAAAVERLGGRLEILGRAVEALDPGLVLLTPGGGIELATGRARRWLRQYFGPTGRRVYRLPDDLQRWVRHEEENLTATGDAPRTREPLVLAVSGAGWRRGSSPSRGSARCSSRSGERAPTPPGWLRSD